MQMGPLGPLGMTSVVGSCKGGGPVPLTLALALDPKRAMVHRGSADGDPQAGPPWPSQNSLTNDPLRLSPVPTAFDCSPCPPNCPSCPQQAHRSRRTRPSPLSFQSRRLDVFILKTFIPPLPCFRPDAFVAPCTRRHFVTLSTRSAHPYPTFPLAPPLTSQVHLL
jgi:hypothetical protein